MAIHLRWANMSFSNVIDDTRPMWTGVMAVDGSAKVPVAMGGDEGHALRLGGILIRHSKDG